jgi:hypothetical protein
MPAVETIEEFLKNSDAVRKILARTVEKHQQVYDIEKVPFLEISINKIKKVNPGLAKKDEKNVKKLLIRIKLND